MPTTLLDRPTTRTLQEIIAAVSPTLATYAEVHDRDGSFVVESYDALKEAGFFRAGIPSELGGLGASLSDLAFAHHDLASACASTSLASAMHSHSVATLAWRYRRGAPVEKTLRKIADEDLILVSTGGADHVRPTTVARRVEGGYLVSGRKSFASQAPVGSILSTWAVRENDPTDLIGLSIPMSADGLRVLDTWDSHGMRGTGSQDIALQDVFVSDAQVGAHRPFGKLDPLIRIALINGLTIITGVYLGVIRAIRDEVVRVSRAGRGKDDPRVHRLVGEVEHAYTTARLGFEGGLARLTDDPESSPENFNTVLHVKKLVASTGRTAADAAMEAVGGASFYRTSPLERLARDLRGIVHHPLPPEATSFYAGRLALGGDPDEV